MEMEGEENEKALTFQTNHRYYELNTKTHFESFSLAADGKKIPKMPFFYCLRLSERNVRRENKLKAFGEWINNSTIHDTARTVLLHFYC